MKPKFRAWLKDELGGGENEVIGNIYEIQNLQDLLKE